MSTPPGPIPGRSGQVRRRNTKWIDKAKSNATSPVKPGEPPRNGKGATIAAWREYATGLGHEVAKGATKAAIITQVDEGLPAEATWHPLARDWFMSLAASGQSVFYEPSDWATARVLAELLSRGLKSGKVTGALIDRWQSGATELLTTEGARRRMRLELERPEEGDEGEGGADVVSELDDWRRRLRGDATG